MKHYQCKFCDYNSSNSNSVASHTKWCKCNPSRYTSHVFVQPDGWLHSVQNANRNTEINKKRQETYQNNRKNGLHKPNVGRASTPEKELARRWLISDTMKKNPNAGGLREGSGRGKKQWYESPIAGKVYVRSSYELEYVKWLDKNNIKWKGNLIKFPYEFEGKIKYYYPDFYLIENDEYVEIKGYKTKKDEAKWKNFPYKLTILFKTDLLNMGLNISKW